MTSPVRSEGEGVCGLTLRIGCVKCGERGGMGTYLESFVDVTYGWSITAVSDNDEAGGGQVGRYAHTHSAVINWKLLCAMGEARLSAAPAANPLGTHVICFMSY